MDDLSQDEVKEYMHAVRTRMLRHTIHPLPKALDARTAMIMLRNGLFQYPLKSSIPEELWPVLENPAHACRSSEEQGPFVACFEGKRTLHAVALTEMLLQPESRLRKASANELCRRIDESRQTYPILCPRTRRRFEELRETVVSEDLDSSLSASLELNDLFQDDYFYHLAGVKQADRLGLKDDFVTLFKRVLRPNARMIDFLCELPISCPSRQEREAEQLRIRIIEKSSSLHELLHEFFWLFGHLPLAGDNSAAGTVRAWIGGRHPVDDPWSEVWTWANENRSPLACYHACQLFCWNPEWLPTERQRELLTTISEIIVGAVRDGAWKLRCDLARHYCRHLEALDFGADGERVAAIAWWFAEYLGELFDSLSSKARETCMPLLDEAFRVSDEVWAIGRPPVSASSLRYGTRFSQSIWATSILCELSASGLLEHTDPETTEVSMLTQALGTTHGKGIQCVGRDHRDFAFESTTIERMNAELEELVRTLPMTQNSEALAVSNEFRMQAACGNAPFECLFDSFSDPAWRTAVLVNGSDELVELVCSAAIETTFRDSDHDWRSYLPHFIALSCEDAKQQDRKRLLFAYTVVASVASSTVSAVERLLAGENRFAYQDFVSKWRERIERVTPVAPAWIAARLRAMKCVLHVG